MFELFKCSGFAFELFGPVIAGVFDKQPFADAKIALALFDTETLGKLGKTYDRLVVELGIGRIGDVLFLYGRVDDNTFDTVAFEYLCFKAAFNRLLQEFVELFLFKALSKAAHGASVYGEGVLKYLFSAEVLIVGVFDVCPHDTFVA